MIQQLVKKVRHTIGHRHCYVCHQYSDSLVCKYCDCELVFEDYHQCIELSIYSRIIKTNNLLYRDDIVSGLLPPAYIGLYALSSYTWPVDKLIMELKFSGKTLCADILSQWFIERVGVVASEPLHALVPIPLSDTRYASRQYNQSELLATTLGSQLHLPVLNLLTRTKATKAQARLSRAQRQQNVNDAFTAKALVEVSHVALVDDVLTTGATLNAACHALLKCNPDLRISVIVMAIATTTKQT